MLNSAIIRSILVLTIKIHLVSCSANSFIERIDFNPDYTQSNMSKAEFNEIINDVMSIYRPIIQSRVKDGYNVALHVYPEWENNEVNAYADQVGAHWHIWIKGGLARHHLMTRLGLIAVVCHEIGHHLAGYPIKETSSWASAEGQCDYFAAHVCMKKVFQRFGYKYDDGSSSKFCANMNDEDRIICDLSLAAAKSDADLLGYYWRPRMEVDYLTPDNSVAPRTNTGYPNPQCRLDTFFEGTFCFKQWNDYEIPTGPYAACERPTCWYR